MVVSWIFAVLALLQGLSALSPIPDTGAAEEEWTSFANQLRDPAYRLPTTTRPRHYEVNLTPYFENVNVNTSTPFTFDGLVTIYLSPTEANVSEIVMHCNDLTIYTLAVSTLVGGVEQSVATTGGIPVCEMPYSFLRITPTNALQVNQEYIVRMTFLGNLQTNMRGFYRSWYVDRTQRRWMATTQFQPGHARQAFPCYDEPGFKATFDITINREPDFSPTISNMPISSNVTLDNGRIAETFYTTPITSTYLLAFIVSHYARVATTTNVDRPFDIYARDNAGSTGDWSLVIGEQLLEAMEQYTNYSYYGMAENLDMKQAAIPDFSAGAMENWGLLTYREVNILYDPLNSNHFYRQRVANIVAHEIAHMWFGNLVTCAWWDNLWLNEAFARFYQYFLTNLVAPDMGYPTRFIVEQVHVAMLADSLDSAHALTDPNVNDPTTVSAHFSTITYARGAAVLRMTQHLMGETTYLAGLRSYLAERAFDVAEPHHLFNALDAAAAADNALSAYSGVTIDSYLTTWSVQAGHPLLTVNVDQLTGQMLVTQARWERTTGVSSIPTNPWQIPITWTRAGSPDFEDLKPSQVLTEQVTVLNRGTTGLEWVLFNKQETGFYRVNYDDTNWGLLTRALRSSERTTIHDFNRAQIVDDVFAFARAGTMSYARAFNILSFLEFEDEYAPWVAAIPGFNWVLRRLAHNEVELARVQNEIIRLSATVTATLGFAELGSESYMTNLERMYVMEFLCNVGHPQCVSAAVTAFQNWRNGTFVPANMRPWVYCAGLREGSADDFNYFWNRYLTEDLASEKIVMLQTIGCTRDSASLFTFLDQVVADNDNIRPQDHATSLNSATTGNEENTQIVFQWLQNNIAETVAAMGSAATPVSYIAARLLNENQIAEFQSWLNNNQNALGTAYTTGVNGIASTRVNLQWSADRTPEMSSYLDVGYVDDVVDLDPETEAPATDAPVATTAAPAPEPDSANIAALSVVTLLVTLALNFAV